MNSRIKIAVVVASYNAVTSISDCIESVLSQSYDNVELIIVDGGSNDGTVGILKSYEGRIQYWLSEPDKGIYDAWNKALGFSSSDYIYFMGCDDRFVHNDLLYEMVQFLDAKKPYPDLICGSVKMIGKNKDIGYLLKPDPKVIPYKMLPHQGVFHSRSLFDEFGLYDDRFKVRGDFEFVVRCNAARLLRIEVMPFVVAICELGGLSNSWKYAWLSFMETLNIRRTHHVPIYTIEFCLLAVKSFVKRLLAAAKQI